MSRESITREQALQLLDRYVTAAMDRHCCGDEFQPELDAATEACLKAFGIHTADWIRAQSLDARMNPPRSYESQASSDAHGTASHVAPASPSIPSGCGSGVSQGLNIGSEPSVPNEPNAIDSHSVRCLLTDGEKSASRGADDRGISSARATSIYTHLTQRDVTVDADRGAGQPPADNAEISTRDSAERCSPGGKYETPSRDVSNPHQQPMSEQPIGAAVIGCTDDQCACRRPPPGLEPAIRIAVDPWQVLGKTWP